MTLPGPTRELRIGGIDKATLLARLKAQQVAMNEHARTLFASERFTVLPVAHDIHVCQATVASLGLPEGGDWLRLLAAAAARGLGPCPPEAAAHLRRVFTDQAEDASDALTGAGRAPAGSLTVMSLPLSPEVTFPRGFYLRRLDGVDWLRGYRCDDAHVWSPDHQLLWQVMPTA